MSIRTSLGQFERLAQTIGASNALILCAFFGGSGKGSLYIPGAAEPDHLIAKLIGPNDFRLLVEEHGGATISVPSLDGLEAIRRAGQVAHLMSFSVPNRAIAASMGISTRRVQQLRLMLESDGLSILPDGAESAFAGDHEEAPQPQRRVARSAYVAHQPTRTAV